jgi:hypothetical protein
MCERNFSDNTCHKFYLVHVKDYEISCSKPYERNISYYIFLYIFPLVWISQSAPCLEVATRALEC